MEQIDVYIEHLKNTRDISSLPSNYIRVLENELSTYIINIKSSDTYEAADNALTKLEPFQEKLAELSFRYNITLSERLNTVVKFFDRPDDVDARKYFYKIVKEKF